MRKTRSADGLDKQEKAVLESDCRERKYRKSTNTKKNKVRGRGNHSSVVWESETEKERDN